MKISQHEYDEYLVSIGWLKEWNSPPSQVGTLGAAQKFGITVRQAEGLYRNMQVVQQFRDCAFNGANHWDGGIAGCAAVKGKEYRWIYKAIEAVTGVKVYD